MREKIVVAHPLKAGMSRLFDPERWLRKRLERQRARHAFRDDRRKPELTPEEARRDHWQMLRFMGFHALAGALIGAGVGIALILFDIGGLGTLVARSANPVLPVLLVVVPFASIFGGAAAGSAILTLPYDKKYRDDEDDRDSGSK
ncbi:hypothetical protein J2046_001463 [Rhizobium petrolearium]|uniref:hypothetical protein n=1 Tax=Neorhizobium petrolearium TaxID=515361 RepID=UPI001F1B154B|nr:hypothetical protein [Neorhizobium petrolearium]MBP1843209.1 hypothetical protein [Neorhizobium petrolearium]